MNENASWHSTESKSDRFESASSGPTDRSTNHVDNDESIIRESGISINRNELTSGSRYQPRRWQAVVRGTMASILERVDYEFGYSIPNKDIISIFADEDENVSNVTFDVASQFGNLILLKHVREIDAHIEEIKAWIKQVHEIQNFQSQSTTMFSQSNFLRRFQRTDESVAEVSIPVDVIVTPVFEESLRGLSASLKHIYHEKVSHVNNFVEMVAKIPKLMKTVILINDEEDRERIMDYPIIKRVMMCKYSIIETSYVESQGNMNFESWITELLRSKSQKRQKKVVDYLERISSMTPKDFSFITDSPSSSRAPYIKHLSSLSRVPSEKQTADIEHMEEFNKQRQELFETVRAMKSLMPSLLLLSQHEIDRASMTNIVRNVLSWELSRPFGVTVVFLDILSQLAMLLLFRPQLQITLDRILGRENGDADTFSWLSNILGLGNETVGYGTFELITAISLLYRIFRRVVKDLSMLSISWKVMVFHSLSFWNLVDFTTVSLIFFCLYAQFSEKLIEKIILGEVSIWSRVVGVTIGFLWLNMLGLLKIMNESFATFVLAIAHIVKDVLLFLLIMLIIVLAFGDMLYAILAFDQSECPENFEPSYNISIDLQRLQDRLANPNPFCEKKSSSYLAVYRVFVGDFTYDDFEGATWIYCILTFFGIIILLNVLIALVCASYHNSQGRAERLLGGARIAYVAELSAFEALLCPRQSSDKHNSCIRYWLSSRGLAKIVMYLFCSIIAIAVFFLLIVLISLFAEGFLINGINRGWSIFLGILIISPILHIWLIFASFMCTGWGGKRGKKCSFLHKFQHNLLFKFFFAIPVMYVTRLLLGTITWNGRSISTNNISTQKEERDEINDGFKSLEYQIDLKFTGLNSRLDNIENVPSSNRQLDKENKIDKFREDEINDRFKSLESRIDLRFTGLNNRLDNIENKLDEFEKHSKINERRVAEERNEAMALMEERIKEEIKMMEQRIMCNIERALTNSQSR